MQCVLDSSSFQEMSAAVGKAPVSVLQDLLNRRGTTPKYVLILVEDAIREPTFRYRLKTFDMDTYTTQKV
jgi:RISC-loading complex subunit TARBP2